MSILSAVTLLLRYIDDYKQKMKSDKQTENNVIEGKKIYLIYIVIWGLNTDVLLFGFVFAF